VARAVVGWFLLSSIGFLAFLGALRGRLLSTDAVSRTIASQQEYPSVPSGISIHQLSLLRMICCYHT